MRALVLLLLLAGCGAEFGSGAQSGAQSGAGSCRLEKLAEMPVRIVNNVPVLTVEINGRPASMVLDTGSDATVLTRVAARRLGVVEAGAARSIGGAAGRTMVGAGKVGSLAMGGIRLDQVSVLLGDAPAAPLDGLLGINVLVDFELELDLPHQRAAFYRARPCATAMPDWTGPMVRLPVQQQAGSGHLFVSLQVDGQALRGMLDTGASSSTLSTQSAEDAGLRGRALAALPASRGQAVNPEGVVVRRALFRELRIGGDVIVRPALTIADLPAYAGDMLIGEDYLGARRVWFSFVMGRVFVAGAEGR